MKVKELKHRRKSLTALVFDEETDPKELGAEIDPVGLIAIDSELCETEHISVGTEISEQELVDLIAKSHIKRAKSRAMWYLSRSSLPKAGLIKKLGTAFPEYACLTAADRMEELGLINDKDYASRRLERLLCEKKVSLKLAKQMLLAEGLDRETVDQVLEMQEDNYDTDTAIADIFDRRFSGKLNTKKDFDRMFAYFLRKGFAFSQLKSFLREREIEIIYNEEL
jgi:regulatory protein